jgi:hypothetical protein
MNKQAILQAHKLKELSELKLNLELAHLARIDEEENVHRRALEHLSRSEKNQRMHVEKSESNICPAELDAHHKWSSWVKDKRRSLNIDIAKVSEKRERQKAITRRALGRVDALSTIKDRLKAD